MIGKSVKKRKGLTAAQKKLMLMLLPDSTMEGIRITGAIAPSFVVGVQFTVFLITLQLNPSLSFLVRCCPNQVYNTCSVRGSLKILQRASLDVNGQVADGVIILLFNSIWDGTVSLRVQGSMALKQIRGNCRKRPLDKDLSIDNTLLPKRK